MTRSPEDILEEASRKLRLMGLNPDKFEDWVVGAELIRQTEQLRRKQCGVSE